MKKSIVFGALALAGTAFAVESATVGYINKGELPVGYSMIATQFVEPGATDTTVNLLDYVAGDFTAAEYSKRDTDAPMIKIYTEGAGYAEYFYLTDAYDEVNDDEVLGWANGAGDLVDAINVNAGAAVWVICPTVKSGTVTFKGQVATDATLSRTCVPGYTMVCSPFPKDTTTAGMTFSAELTAADYSVRDTQAPMMKVYTEGAGYTEYYYLNDAYDEVNDDEVLGWANGAGDLIAETDVIAPAGKGFWVILPASSENVTVEFSNPLN